MSIYKHFFQTLKETLGLFVLLHLLCFIFYHHSIEAQLGIIAICYIYFMGILIIYPIFIYLKKMKESWMMNRDDPLSLDNMQEAHTIEKLKKKNQKMEEYLKSKYH